MHARMQANIFTGQREREREKCQKKSGNGYSWKRYSRKIEKNKHLNWDVMWDKRTPEIKHLNNEHLAHNEPRGETVCQWGRWYIVCKRNRQECIRERERERKKTGEGLEIGESEGKKERKKLMKRERRERQRE